MFLCLISYTLASRISFVKNTMLPQPLLSQIEISVLGRLIESSMQITGIPVRVIVLIPHGNNMYFWTGPSRK